jgi:hypothetical protein
MSIRIRPVSCSVSSVPLCRRVRVPIGAARRFRFRFAPVSPGGLRRVQQRSSSKVKSGRSGIAHSACNEPSVERHPVTTWQLERRTPAAWTDTTSSGRTSVCGEVGRVSGHHTTRGPVSGHGRSVRGRSSRRRRRRARRRARARARTRRDPRLPVIARAVIRSSVSLRPASRRCA